VKASLEKLVSELLATGQFETFSDPRSPRARIARAALELFAEHSYEGTTTKAIAARARTTERTLFKHFKSKDQLFARTVFPAFLKALMPTLLEPGKMAPFVDARTFRAALRAFLVNRITVAVQNPTLIVMMWRELLTRPAFRSAHEAVLAKRGRPIVASVIAKGRKSGELREIPADLILRTISGHLVAYLATRLVLAPQQAWDTEADADQMLDLVMRGIGRARPHK
jgi:AcrR family transcriptional regulator